MPNERTGGLQGRTTRATNTRTTRREGDRFEGLTAFTVRPFSVTDQHTRNQRALEEVARYDAAFTSIWNDSGGLGDGMGRLRRVRQALTSDFPLRKGRHGGAPSPFGTAARKLFISKATVKTRLTHFYAKLGVSDRAAAVAVAYERKILG